MTVPVGPTTAAPGAASPLPVPVVDGCPLCRRRAAETGRLVWQGEALHVVLVDEPGHPCFFRVVCNDHVAEVTDLDAPGRAQLWRVLLALEAAIRQEVAPVKVNLASLGNRVPHLHWHVIGRWPDDPHFPESVWSEPQRPPDAGRTRERGRAVAAALPAIRQVLAQEAGG